MAIRSRSYAVRWWSPGETPHVGKLELRDAGARLSARGVQPTAIDRCDVVDLAIARASTPPTGDPATLVIQRRNAEPIFVQSVLGFGVLHELADSLAPVNAPAA